jgi:hypothetical protein
MAHFGAGGSLEACLCWEGIQVQLWWFLRVRGVKTVELIALQRSLYTNLGQ